MKPITQWLSKVSGSQDIILATMLMVAIFMMILPLPTWIVDVLIAFNLMVSLMLLMIAVYLQEPLEFSSFPALLLITTLYRLSLSISTTRLILLHHDAGEIVYTFGNFVVGGNIAVGLIIFSIITIVQFIVITKGSERVAEVGARFSLDAMPGKQMSIDGDMRAGFIDSIEASRLRGLVQKESQLYGAMDGAMKFVKGDAIASIIVILVNIFGGMIIGMTTHGMSASEAINTYAILSVGDGLISQIPALLISISAGIIVTRVPGAERRNLAADLANQMGKQPRPLLLAAGVLVVFAILPGFPAWVFLPLAIMLGVGGWMLQKRHVLAVAEGDLHGDEEHEFSPGSIPLSLQLNKEDITAALRDTLNTMRWHFFEKIGVPVPDIKILPLKNNAMKTVTIELYQESVCQHNFKENMVLLQPDIKLKELDYIITEPFSVGGELYMVESAQFEQAKDNGAVPLNDEQRIVHLLERVLLRYAKEFVGIQETRFLMDAMESRYEELIKEVQRQMPLSKVADVMQRLVEEQIGIRDLRTIFEALITWGPKEKDIVVLTEYVRLSLRRHILGKYRDDNGIVHGWLIGSGIENMIRESIRSTAAGAYSSLTPEQNQQIIDQVDVNLQGRTHTQLLTAIDVRRYLRKIIEKRFYNVHVISFQEIGDDTNLNILGNIEIYNE